MMTPSSTMWGGRFSEATDAFVAEFTASVTFDKRLYKHDIQGSCAHATMLAKVGVLTAAPHSRRWSHHTNSFEIKNKR